MSFDAVLLSNPVPNFNNLSRWQLRLVARETANKAEYL